MKHDKPLPNMMTVSEVTQYLRVSKATVRRWISDGTLQPAFQFGKGGDYRIKSEAVENCLKDSHVTKAGSGSDKI